MHMYRDLLLGGALREDSGDDPDAIPGTAEQKRRLSDASAGGSGMLNPARPSRRSLNMDPLAPVGEQLSLQGARGAFTALRLCILKTGRLGVWRGEALAGLMHLRLASYGAYCQGMAWLPFCLLT